MIISQGQEPHDQAVAVTSTLLDAQGLSCPLPILRAAKLLRAMPSGAEVTVLATDPVALADFPVFCTQTGNILLECVTEINGSFRFRLRKG
jgi:tRNA 2-thiouridine synthesizing protein A